jgi:hypothetical protein
MCPRASDSGRHMDRHPDRIRKTFSLPRTLATQLQAEADAAHRGDLTQALLHRLAPHYPGVADFLATHRYFSRAPKKNPKKVLQPSDG